MSERSRDYKKEYASYHGTSEQKKRRAQRNSARRKAEREGRVHKGDGKEVDHTEKNRKGPLNNKKTRVISKRENRKKQPKRNGKDD